MKSEIIKTVSLKGMNKRIGVALYKNEDGTHHFVQGTKTLIDRKTRNILTTKNIFSVESYAVIHDVMSKFFEDSEITRKILNLELSKINKFKGNSNF